jgi:S-adenosylmethionine-dependent methyltransferase
MTTKFWGIKNELKEKFKFWYDTHRIPSHLSANYIYLDDSDLDMIRMSLERNYFSKEKSNYLETAEGKKDLNDHLLSRLNYNRTYTIPWLDSLRPLKDARILEIGCGPGASTVALAEQGAKVTAIDIDAAALIDAKVRCETYGLDVDFVKLNATKISEYSFNISHDIIIFSACIEHMTYDERLGSINNAWNILPSGGLICILETPNRLWFYDSHTSLMPFFFWLPDEIARKYYRFSPRKKFREDDIMDSVQFARWGRGVSFHEFELAIGNDLNVVGYMQGFIRKRILRRIKWTLSKDFLFEYLLRKIDPHIHRAFYQPLLYLAIKK